LVGDEDFGAFRPPDAVPHQLLVRFRSNATRVGKQTVLDPFAEEIRFLNASNLKRRIQPRAMPARDSVFENLALVKLKDDVTIGVALAHFHRQPDVLYAEPNCRLHLAQSTPAQKLPNDFDFAKLWNLQNTGQTGGTNGAGLHAPEAWTRGTGSRRVKVAVID